MNLLLKQLLCTGVTNQERNSTNKKSLVKVFEIVVMFFSFA